MKHTEAVCTEEELSKCQLPCLHSPELEAPQRRGKHTPKGLTQKAVLPAFNE